MSAPVLTIDQLERFWAKVRFSDGCWEWTGCRLPSGYGKVAICGRHFLVHRLVWLIWNGSLDPTKEVSHLCHNTSCCRPSHLLECRHVENVRHSVESRRHTAGERHHQARLKSRDAEEIRSRYAEGGLSQYELASEYGVHQPQVSRIVRGERWSEGIIQATTT